jgi:hypothetical protein
MRDLKELINKRSFIYFERFNPAENQKVGYDSIKLKDLGLFFWGKLKLHILNCQKQLNDLKERQKKCKKSEFGFFKYLLDNEVKYKEESMQRKYKGVFVGENKVYYEISIACLGEDKVKELIKELKE